MKKDEMAMRKELSEKKKRLKERLSAIPGTLDFLIKTRSPLNAYPNSRNVATESTFFGIV